MRTFRIVLWTLVVVAAIGATGLFAYSISQKSKGENTLLGGPGGGQFALVDQRGNPADNSVFLGKPSLLFFGYTHCPDACPTTMAETKVAFAELGEKAADVQVIMISIDPERDTPEALAAYVQQFDPRFLGGTATLDEVTALASAYGVFFEKHEGSVATGYLIDHSAQMLVVDRQGYTRMIFPYGLRGEDMATDLRYLLSL